MGIGRGWRPSLIASVGRAIVFVGIGALLVVFSQGRGDRSDFGFGLIYPLSRIDQLLALVGLAAGIARAPLRIGLSALALFGLGALCGLAGVDRILDALPGTYQLTVLFLVWPAACALVGVALLLPEALRAYALLGLALLAGVAFGFGISLNDPTLDGNAFAIGALASGLWLAAAPRLAIPSSDVRGIEIAIRIFGSWLIAIGLMLGGSHLLPLRN